MGEGVSSRKEMGAGKQFDEATKSNRCTGNERIVKTNVVFFFFFFGGEGVPDW